jgi:surfeit locus 1 family protein
MFSPPKNGSRYDLRFWIVTLSALLMAGLMFSLGIWQLDRAAQKQKLSQERHSALPIRLSGQWAAQQTLYVDNRQMNGKQGFFVVTPLVTSSAEYVLVERGWIPRDFMDRKKLQSIQTPATAVAIDVRQLADPVLPAVFAKEMTIEYPIVQFVDLGYMAKVLPDKVYKGMVRQLGDASEGLKRDWYEPASGVEKHYGYALQWFAMSATVLGLYLWFQWIKPKLTKQI